MPRLVIQFLVPSITHSWPSRTARVRMPPGSEPASGSDRAKAGLHSPLAHRGLGRVVPRDPAHAAAPPRPRPTDPHVRMLGLNPPPTHLLLGLRERPAQVPMKDVSAGHPKLALQIGRCQSLDAGRT